MKSRNVMRILCVVLVASLLGGCSTTTVNEPTAQVAQSTPIGDSTAIVPTESVSVATCPDVATGANIQFWTPLTGPDGNAMTDLVNLFNKTNSSGVQVSHLITPDLLTKLGAAAASKTLPDLVLLNGEDIPTQAARGILRPIPVDASSVIGLGEDDFPIATWKAGQFKDQQYTIPLHVFILAMFYNKDMFTTAGLSLPSDQPLSKDDYEKAVGALTKDGIQGWSITTGTFPSRFVFQALLHQFGGSEFDESGTKVTWNSEAGVKALQYLRDAQGKFAKPNQPQDSGVTAFKQGTSAVEWNGMWQIANMVKPHEFAGVAPIPQLGDQYAVWGGSLQIGFANQEEPDPGKESASACFIRWLSDNSLEWAKAGQLPARKSVLESDEFKQVQPQATLANGALNIFLLPSIPGIGEALGPMDQAVSAVLAGQADDVKKALDDAATKGQKILEANQEKYGQ